jgi:hypothetical protein
MELYIKDNLSDITYMSELTPAAKRFGYFDIMHLCLSEGKVRPFLGRINSHKSATELWRMGSLK